MFICRDHITSQFYFFILRNASSSATSPTLLSFVVIPQVSLHQLVLHTYAEGDMIPGGQQGSCKLIYPTWVRRNPILAGWSHRGLGVRTLTGVRQCVRGVERRFCLGHFCSAHTEPSIYTFPLRCTSYAICQRTVFSKTGSTREGRGSQFQCERYAWPKDFSVIPFLGERKIEHCLLHFTQQLIKLQIFTWRGSEFLQDFRVHR